MNPEKNLAPFIQFELIAANEINAISDGGVLGLHCIGTDAISVVNHLPMQRIAMPLLNDGGSVLFELWRTNTSCCSGQFQDIKFRATDTMLFGVIELDESRLDLSSDESTVCAAAEIAYRQIFLLLEAKGFTHLWRTWNYLPAIHAEECGLERYRQFNVGRHRAFAAGNRPVDSSPAASALGVASGLFSVAFIAGRSEPIRIENPRQISAFDYPFQYGPRSPTFSRAVTVANGDFEALFISGTASIVGHETVHPNDVVAQTQETVANLAILLEQANARTNAAFFTLTNLIYRVYIRHADDFHQVQQILNTSIGSSIRAIYVQADICRQDLLIEIEAFAVRPLSLDNA